VDIPQRSLVKGDARCMSIACASILAKTERDALMRELEEQYPGYGLGKNKGYGTQAHRSALKRLGLSDIHRRTFHVK
jgi:ribonuclease HII